MKTYKIQLTDEEHSALHYILEKGWDYLMDGDYFYGIEEEKPIFEAALAKIHRMEEAEQ